MIPKGQLQKQSNSLFPSPHPIKLLIQPPNDCSVFSSLSIEIEWFPETQIWLTKAVRDDDEEEIQYFMEAEVNTASFGTSGSFALRLGQTFFSSASLLFMCFDQDFYTYSAFCYLVTVMGLVTPWSVSLALMDAYSVIVKPLPRQTHVLSIIILGDFVLSFLSLAGACATASVADLMVRAGDPFCHENQCGRYQLSAGMAALSWFLSFGSTLFNLWLLTSQGTH